MCLCVCLSLCVFAGNKPELNCPSTVPVVSDWTCCEAEKVSHAQSPEHECNREYDPREMDGAPFRQLHKLFFELRFFSRLFRDSGFGVETIPRLFFETPFLKLKLLLNCFETLF